MASKSLQVQLDELLVRRLRQVQQATGEPPEAVVARLVAETVGPDSAPQEADGTAMPAPRLNPGPAAPASHRQRRRRPARPRGRTEDDPPRGAGDRPQFVARIASELRTPLSSILIVAGLLEENEGGHLDEREQRFVRRIQRAAADALRLVDDMRDLARIESGQVRIFVESVDLTQVLEEVETWFRPQVESKGLCFTTAVADGAPRFLHTDRKRLHQILTSLLAGALRSTEEGSIRLEAALAEAGSVLRVGRGGREVLALTVSDTGCGIPQERWEAIFEPLAEPDPRTSREHGGMGLGLTLAKALTEALGGSLTLESEEGMGSRFTAYLPTAPEPRRRRRGGVGRGGEEARGPTAERRHGDR